MQAPESPASAANAAAAVISGFKREFQDDRPDVDRYPHRRHLPLDGGGGAVVEQTVSPVEMDDGSASPSDTPAKKQKRNKPTLSCFECVERKTKVRIPFC